MLRISVSVLMLVLCGFGNLIRKPQFDNKIYFYLYLKIKTIMTTATFKHSITGNEPPQNISVYLQALWYDAKNNWQKAHALIQDLEDKDAAWIHAYLHRKESDNQNADYWYRRAGKSRPAVDFLNEWEQIVTAFL